MGLREHVLDLLTGFNIPLGYIVGQHVFFPLFPHGASALRHHAFTHGLHDLEGLLRFHTHLDQIQHDIVTGTDGGGNRCHAAHDQILCISQPYVGTVGQAGNTHQIGKCLGLGIDNHLHGEIGTKLRDTQCPQLCSADLLRSNAQRIRILEQTHDILSV